MRSVKVGWKFPVKVGYVEKVFWLGCFRVVKEGEEEGEGVYGGEKAI